MFDINWFSNIVKNTSFCYFSIVILFMKNINFQSNLDFYYNKSVLSQAADHFMYNSCVSVHREGPSSHKAMGQIPLYSQTFPTVGRPLPYHKAEPLPYQKAEHIPRYGQP